MIWFKFYTIWSEGLRELSDAEAGRFIKSLCEFAETGETQAQSGNERYLLSMALKQMKQDAEHNAKVSSARAEAGRIGGLSSKNLEAKQAIANNCKQNEANKAIANNCSIKNKELRSQNTEREVINTCAEAHVSAPEKPRLVPNDHDFWKFAKENAELAEAFYRASGIYPVGSQFGRWMKDLRDFAEAGITIPQMQAAVRKIRAEGRITISAPGSVFSTARDIALGGSRVNAQPQQRRTWSAVEVAQMMEEGRI